KVAECARKHLGRAVDVPAREVEERSALDVVEQRADPARPVLADLAVRLDHDAGKGASVQQQQHEILRRRAGGVGGAEEVASRLARRTARPHPPCSMATERMPACSAARAAQISSEPSRHAFGTSTISHSILLRARAATYSETSVRMCPPWSCTGRTTDVSPS